MTKKEWLARCANAYDMGLVEREGLLTALERAADTFDRLVHDETKTLLGRRDWGDGDHQTAIARDNVHVAARAAAQESRESFGDHKDAPTSTLANSPSLYGAVQLAALLAHPCQRCAEDPGAWHTRWGFCPHRGTLAVPMAESEMSDGPV